MRPARVLALALICGALAPAARAGESACWVENGEVVVPALYGDVSGDFILDLSAPTSRLNDSVANAHGIEGEAMSAPMTLAGEDLPAFPMAISDIDSRAWGSPTTINGILGADLVRDLVVELSFSPCRLTLSRRPLPPMPGALRLPVLSVAGAPAVAATAFDGTRTRRGVFAVDTASGGLLVARASLSRPVPPGAYDASRGEPVGRLRALTLDDRVFQNVPASLMPKPPEGLDGAIGLAVWTRFRMRLDLRNGWLELAPP